jgi:hypothetical protein
MTKLDDLNVLKLYEHSMTDLSPAADAVLDAYNSGFDRPVAVHHKPRIAAALRAAATAIGVQEMFHPDSKRTEGVKWCVQNIYAIADELERQTTTNSTQKQ